MASPEGLEPPTSDLEGRCSIQLSYGLVKSLVDPAVIAALRAPVAGPSPHRQLAVSTGRAAGFELATAASNQAIE